MHQLTRSGRWQEKYGPETRHYTNLLTHHLVLQRVAGKDASKQFWKYHNEGILKKYKAQLQIGSLDTKKAAPAPEPTPAKSEPAPAAAPATPTEYTPPATGVPQDPYGDLIPFADPSWYQGVSRRHTVVHALANRDLVCLALL